MGQAQSASQIRNGTQRRRTCLLFGRVGFRAAAVRFRSRRSALCFALPVRQRGRQRGDNRCVLPGRFSPLFLPRRKPSPAASFPLFFLSFPPPFVVVCLAMSAAQVVGRAWGLPAYFALFGALFGSARVLAGGGFLRRQRTKHSARCDGRAGRCPAPTLGASRPRGAVRNRPHGRGESVGYHLRAGALASRGFRGISSRKRELFHAPLDPEPLNYRSESSSASAYNFVIVGELWFIAF